MRILVLTDLYPPAATGGYERSCADVVDRWRRAGHHVEVLTTRQQLAPAQGQVHRALPFVPATAATGEDERYATRVVDRLIADVRPDVVSAWNLARVPQRGVLTALARSGLPVVVVACDAWLAHTPPDLPALSVGSIVVWVSDQLRTATTPPGWVPSAHTVIGSGIDTGIFASEPRSPHQWRGRLLFVGRLSPAKGVEDAVLALLYLDPSTMLRVVGPGTAQRTRELQALVDEHDLVDRLRFAEAAPADLPAVYAAADALLFPSRWAEPFGLVPLEAMACSLPVVATGTGGSASYLLDGDNAILVPPSRPQELAAAVRRLASDDALRTRLVAGGLRTSRRHDIDRVAVDLADVLRRAVSAVS